MTQLNFVTRAWPAQVSRETEDHSRQHPADRDRPSCFQVLRRRGALRVRALGTSEALLLGARRPLCGLVSAKPAWLQAHRTLGRGQPMAPGRGRCAPARPAAHAVPREPSTRNHSAANAPPTCSCCVQRPRQPCGPVLRQTHLEGRPNPPAPARARVAVPSEPRSGSDSTANAPPTCSTSIQWLRQPCRPVRAEDLRREPPPGRLCQPERTPFLVSPQQWGTAASQRSRDVLSGLKGLQRSGGPFACGRSTQGAPPARLRQPLAHAAPRAS